MHLYGYFKLLNNKSHYKWLISENHRNFYGYSWCDLGNNLASNYVFNIDDCTVWNTKVNYTQNNRNETDIIDQYLTAKRCGFTNIFPGCITSNVGFGAAKDVHGRSATFTIFAGFCWTLIGLVVVEDVVAEEEEEEESSSESSSESNRESSFVVSG